MADQQQDKGSFPRAKFKDLGDGTFAEYMALEPGSVGGSSPTADVHIVDPTVGTQKAAVSAAGRLAVELPAGGGGLTDTELRAAPVPVTTQVPVPVSDNAGSLTVDGTVTANAGVGPFPVNDNGGSLTVDGTVGASKSGSWPLDTAAKGTSAAGSPTSGNLDANTQPLHVSLKETVAVPVTDNAGSLTVDGTVGVNNFPATQPVSIAAVVHVDDNASTLSVDDGGGSLTVDGTFFQATQPVSLATNTPDVTDRAAREVGRVRIWDGTDEATVIPLRTQPATTEKVIPTFEIPNRLATYATTTAEIAPAITIGVKELLAIWYTGGTKDVYIVEIWLTALVTTASTTAGRTTARISTITSAPTGGTELGKVDVSGAGASGITNTMAVKTGGGAIGTTFKRVELWHATQAIGSRVSEPIFQASNPGNGIILRGGGSTGISIDCERVLAHTALVDSWTVGIRWLEI